MLTSTPASPMSDPPDDLLGPAMKLTRSFIWAAKKLARPILQDPQPLTIDVASFHALHAKLAKIRATIADSDHRHVTDHSVALWLSDLRDVESLAVDIIEEFESASTYNQICREVAASTDAFVPSTFFPKPPDLSCLARKIDFLKERCDEIALDRRQFRLREGDGRRRGDASPRPPSSSFPDGELIGREREFKEMVEFLVCDGSSLPVLPVVGMSGVGKTAIVQHVYGDVEVRAYFGVRVWVCVSESFDAMGVLRAFVEGVTEEVCKLRELDTLQRRVRNLVSGKRFLLVLDDLWDVDLEHWETLLKPLRLGGDGSKVILVSSNVNGVKSMGTCRPCAIGCLSDENCWLVCKSYGLKGQDFDADEEFSAVYGHAIRRFKGLPLAAKALGRLMHAAFLDDCTVKYLSTDLYYQVTENILPVLRRSYDRLPAYLKRCFLYCSLFPQGYIFEKDQLVRLWMSQGFVVCEKESQLQCIEAIGRKYFDELAGFSFFQLSPFYDVSEERYVMHDLYHELVYRIAGQEFLRIEDYKLHHVHYLTRHSSLVPSKKDSGKLVHFEPFEGHSLRTFLFIGQLEYKHDTFCIGAFSQKIDLMYNVKIAENLFIHLECLRALDLRNTDIVKLPDSVGSLKHLHFLCLENTKVIKLPESICSLYKLQTLNLKHCYHLEGLPMGTRHLFSLRHLELPSTEQLNFQLPSGIGKLTCLEQLPIFYIGNHVMNCNIAELKSLVNLQGEMLLSGLINVTDENDAQKADLRNKEKLRKLSLQWHTTCWSNGYESKLVEKAESVLEFLQPHHNLEELHIRHYCGLKFPKWIENSIFSRLTTLKLQESAECMTLPSLGQLPALRHLTIEMLNRVRCIGREFLGEGNATLKAFPKLLRLEFMHMSDWEEWFGVQGGDFPCLQSLIISGCPKLKIVPQLNALAELWINNCEQLACLGFSSLQHLRMAGFQNLKLLHFAEVSSLELNGGLSAVSILENHRTAGAIS